MSEVFEQATAAPGEKRKLTELPEGRVLRLKAGDVVVFEFDQELTMEQAANVRESACAVLPKGVQSMVVSNGVKVSVVAADA